MRPPKRLTVPILMITMLCSASPVSATNNLGCHWQGNVNGVYANYIEFAIGDIGGTFPSQSYKDRISNGRTVWNAVGRELYFAWVSTGQKAHVGWYKLNWPNSDKWAVAFHYGCTPVMWGAEIHVNSQPIDGQYTWYTGTGQPGNSQGDLYSVMVHEWGHLVELMHNNQSPDVMQTSIAPGTTRRSLSTHDIAGIKAMYPPK